MKTLLLAALLCEAAYSQSVPEGLGIVTAEKISDEPTCTTGVAYITSDTIWYVFAGTNERKDWLSNFKIIRKNAFGWFPAHKGFAECAEAVSKHCAAIAAQYPTHSVKCAGHSLGGSVALLIAVWLQSRQSVQERAHVDLFTFGQPRVSNETHIRAALPGRYIRVVNGSDVVARIPKLGYSHAGTLIYIKNGKGYCVDPGAVDRFLDRLATWQHDRVTDHMMPGYIRALQRLSV